MKTMRLHKEPRSFESYPSGKESQLHGCPVCDKAHEVSAVRAQFAYGRQFACSLDREAERRRLIRDSYGRIRTSVADDVFSESIARRPSSRESEPRPLKLISSGRDSVSIFLKRAGGDRKNRDFHPSTDRLSLPDEEKTVITVTVESTDVLRVRRAVFQVGGKSIGILKAAPVPHSSKVRLFIGSKIAALESIMIAIIHSISSGEFGRIVRA